jgi:hypothetical protein
MERIIDCLVISGLTGQVSEEIVCEYNKQIGEYTWNSFYTFLCGWCETRLSSLPPQTDLVQTCLGFGLREKLSRHFVETGVIGKPEMIKSHVMLMFLKKSSDFSLCSVD